MAVALDCAYQGLGSVEPNPMVGAVLARDGKSLAQGWHKRFGGPHAEVEALRSAVASGVDPRGCTLYVTLEPCCHFGKTPPCTQAVIDAGIVRVVVAMVDPDSRVAGKGVAALRQAGLDVAVGTLQQEATSLLAAYIKLRTASRPWVICKWAQTADGCLALPPGQGRWISGPESLAQVHQMRSWISGIGVGIETVLADDPLLTNRSGSGSQPRRLVIDSSLRTPVDCQLLRTTDAAPVLIATTTASLAQRPDVAKRLRDAGAEIMPAGDGPRVDLPAMLDELGRRQWTYLMIEGGQALLESVLTQSLADELRVYVSPLQVGQGPSTVSLPRLNVRQVLQDLPPPIISAVGVDALMTYRLR